MIQALTKQIEDACHTLFGVRPDVILTRPDSQFGDFATNAALQLAPQLGKNPRELAEALAAYLRDAASETAARIEVAGPGFVNITLTDQALLRGLAQQPSQSLAGQTVLAEYSDPNPFKPLHAGHLYTTLVGDTIARLVATAGAETIRLNYGGDVGLHVGKTMWAIVQHLGGELPEKLADVQPQDRPTWLGQRYVEGNIAYEDDVVAREAIITTNKRVYALHADGDHDSPFAQIYWTCRQWSYDYFATLYDQLQVVPFDRYIPESEVTPLGIETVRTQQERGVFTLGDAVISTGQTAATRPVVFNGDDHGLHTRVFINSEGLPTYETKDVGLSLTKWRDYHFDQSIIITANEQAQYMQVVIKAISQFAPEPAQRTRHLTHGVVKLQGGVKISSRKGNGPTALDILAAAREAGQATGYNPADETILAAVKYAFAKVRIGGDIVYDPQESVALEGNSGPYLQYAHARARSILAKTDTTAQTPEQLDDDERALVRKLAEYAEVVDRAVAELSPHHICTYMYELAQTFNRFYERNRVIGSEREATRLYLVQAYADTLQASLTILGIASPDKM